MKEIKKVYYYEVYRKTDEERRKHFTPVITTNAEEASQHIDSHIASINDVVDDYMAYGVHIQGIFETVEGYYVWEQYEDGESNYRQIHINKNKLFFKEA
jgi:hypothetical protein